MLMQTLFWICVAAVIYAYAGFPLLVLLRGLLIRRSVAAADVRPKVSLIIACHNEEQSIGAKLENIQSQDYPADKMEILIVSDGSTDATESIVSQCADERIRLLSLPRCGKAKALNAAVAASTGEVLVFSDANSQYEAQAVRRLVRPFADEAVGCVAGNQVYRDAYESGSAASGERAYWNLDRLMKVFQSRAGNATSATGAIYAIRRELFEDVPEGVTDDFAISVLAVLKGKRLVFAEDAVCFEPVAGQSAAEFRRKTRVMTRGFRGVVLRRALLNPFRYGFYSWQLFSHKVVRRLVAVPLIVMAGITPAVWSQGGLFQIAAVGQATIYLAALAGWLLSRRGRKIPKALAIPFYFCLVNAAALVAAANVLRGRRIHLWSPERGEASTASRSSASQAGVSMRETAT